MIGTCRRCNLQVKMINVEIVSKSRSKTIFKGYCSICGNEVFSQDETKLNNNLETNE